MKLHSDDQPGADFPETVNGIASALLERYVAGTCTAAETREVRRWAALDPTNQAELDALTQMWRTPPIDERETDTKAVWQRLTEQCELDDAAAREPRVLRLDVSPKARRRWWPVVAAAAAVAFVATTQFDTLRHVFAPATALPDTASIVYATPPGQRARLTLPDGSTVQLGVASVLRIPRSFGAAGPRTLALEGQAFFEVVHDTARPFVIHTAGSIVEDIGTAFNVRAYQGDSAVQVVVTEGSVGLRRAPDAPYAATLTAGELGEITSSGRAVTRRVDVTHYVGWTNGELRFDLLPLADVVRELERWYDVDIQLGNPELGQLRVTAAFQNHTRDEALSRLAQALDLRYHQRGRVAVLEAR